MGYGGLDFVELTVSGSQKQEVRSQPEITVYSLQPSAISWAHEIKRDKNIT